MSSAIHPAGLPTRSVNLFSYIDDAAAWVEFDEASRSRLSMSGEQLLERFLAGAYERTTNVAVLEVLSLCPACLLLPE